MDSVKPKHLIDDHLVIGRIGHYHFGWRAYDDWIIGFWTLKNDELEPVASAMADVRQAEFLFAAPVTPER